MYLAGTQKRVSARLPTLEIEELVDDKLDERAGRSEGSANGVAASPGQNARSLVEGSLRAAQDQDSPSSPPSHPIAHEL